jgi:hypothetical protein
MSVARHPSSGLLGYYHSSAGADLQKDFSCKAEQFLVFMLPDKKDICNTKW